MLEPVRHILGTFNIILASSSPRRGELLNNLGIKFEIIPSMFLENLDPKLFPNPGGYVTETAYKKAEDVAHRIAKNSKRPVIIISADTTVSLDGKLYGKPTTNEEAYKMLSELSGKTHTVYTGVTLLSGNFERKFYTSTEVTMGTLEPDVIWGYINTGEPLDKAGAYGIQKAGGSLIEKINGDYFTVVGLPLHEMCRQLVKLVKEIKEHSVIRQ